MIKIVTLEMWSVVKCFTGYYFEIRFLAKLITMDIFWTGVWEAFIADSTVNTTTQNLAPYSENLSNFLKTIMYIHRYIDD